MPAIIVEGSTLNKDQKRELVSSLTKTASNIMNVSEQSIQVYLQEHDKDNIGVGGVLVSEKHK